MDWVFNNPRRAALFGITGVGTAIFAAPAIASAPLLALAGFGLDGIVKDGMARSQPVFKVESETWLWVAPLRHYRVLERPELGLPL
ncbi:hypothetical protein AAE478_005319 [Parahypoxylon ruwenzoriense]